MASKYLDLNGLSTFWAKIKTRISSSISAIVNTNTGSPGKGKTLTAFSQTDGKVSATFEDINIAASQVTSGSLPVARGGTGGTDASSARTNLDVYSKAESEALARGKVVVVSELPETGTAGTIYYVGPTGTGADKYEEYIWDAESETFVKVGEPSIDLSNYVNTLTQGSGNYVTAITKSGNTLSVSRGTLPSASSTSPKMDGTAAVGTGTTWARADHVHPTDTTRAAASDLTTHTNNTTVHITAAERTAWNAKQGAITFDGTYNASTNKAATVSSITDRIANLDVSSVGGSGKYLSAISETDGKISATATALATAPASGSTTAITAGDVYTALAGKQDTMVAITDTEIENTCV